MRGASLLSEKDFFTDFGRRVFEYTRQMENEGMSEDINLLFTPEEVGRITKMKLSRMKLTENGDEVFLESVNMLKESMNRKNVGKLSNVSDLDSFLKSMRNKEKDGN